MEKIIAILALVTSLFIAAVAGWFSIVGMVAVFSGSGLAAAIMMGGLEVGKLVSAAWLKNNWDVSPKRLTYPGVLFVIILMFVTSMGIFGFLSKSHIEQGAPVGSNVAKIERLDQRIERGKTKITNSQNMLDQLDAEVNTLIKYDKISRADGSKATREAQREERGELNQTIDDVEQNISKWYDEKFELEQGVRAYEVEVGPVKYIAALIYGDDAKDMLDSAVRAVIIILIFVFDPLAVWMLISANHSLMQLAEKKKDKPAIEHKPEVFVGEAKTQSKHFAGEAETEMEQEPQIQSCDSDIKQKPPGVRPMRVRSTKE